MYTRSDISAHVAFERDNTSSYSGFQLRWKSTESGFRHGNIIVPGMFEELLVMSFSAEPNRRRPYDRDLRWRIVF